MNGELQRAGTDEDIEIASPTGETYRTFQDAFTVFNDELFGGALRDCMITLQRRRATLGYFSAQRFGHRRGTEILDEIALNPATFEGRTDREIASTLVHEMVHEWQVHFGRPSRGRYHNKQWAAKMVEIGLIPSHTGEPGGKQTGQSMTHYIAEGGQFDRVWSVLAEVGFKFDYQDRRTNEPGKPPRNLKVRYACPSCAAAAWGKPELRILCIDCGQQMR